MNRKRIEFETISKSKSKSKYLLPPDFFIACKRGHIRNIKLCLERGEDINKNFSRRWVRDLTPLSTLIKYRKYEALEYLIFNSNDLNFNTLVSPKTFLLDIIPSIYYGDDKVFIHMVKKGAIFYRDENTLVNDDKNITPYHKNINRVDKYGDNFLLCALQHNYTSDFIFELLQMEDLDINHRNNSGGSALYYVCIKSDTTLSRISIQQFLDLRRDAYVNIKDRYGNTPLFFINNKMENYKPLIDAGADIFIKNKGGEIFSEYNKWRLDEGTKNKIIEYYQDFQDRKRRIKPSVNRGIQKTEEEE